MHFDSYRYPYDEAASVAISTVMEFVNDFKEVLNGFILNHYAAVFKTFLICHICSGSFTTSMFISFSYVSFLPFLFNLY